MAVALEFISLIIPVKTIEQKYPGGFRQFKKDKAHAIGITDWYDDHLYRTGARHQASIEQMIKELERFGFEPEMLRDGEMCWKDVCVVDYFGESAKTCDWLALGEEAPNYRHVAKEDERFLEMIALKYSVWRRGTEPGRVMGRDDFFQDESPYDLHRFWYAQEDVIEQVLAEIKNGKKETHWMWFIFPQIEGLGFSDTARRFAIKSAEEAQAYIENTKLRIRLKECMHAVLMVEGRSAQQIFGVPDCYKLRSCATLFALLAGEDSVYSQVLAKYYNGAKCEQTLRWWESNKPARKNEKKIESC